MVNAYQVLDGEEDKSERNDDGRERRVPDGDGEVEQLHWVLFVVVEPVELSEPVSAVPGLWAEDLQAQEARQEAHGLQEWNQVANDCIDCHVVDEEVDLRGQANSEQSDQSDCSFSVEQALRGLEHRNDHTSDDRCQKDVQEEHVEVFGSE